MSTTVGFITVCAAAAGDIVAWILLALLVSLINATTPIMPLYVVLMAIGWCIILVYVVRPLLLSLVRLTHSVCINVSIVCCILRVYYFPQGGGFLFRTAIYSNHFFDVIFWFH